MSSYLWKEVYTGEEKLAIAMDIGTTHSAVSFAHLLKNQEPVIHVVTDWPGQSGVSKIPTIAAYKGKQGKAWGSEAMAMDLGKERCQMAKWFKLHLHPPSMTASAPGERTSFEIPRLPNGVTIERVYVDFMVYLKQCTQKFFERRLPNGEEIWRRLHDTALIILTVPNGWSYEEHNILRSAAVHAKLVAKTTQLKCLQFVSEGEASVHWALAYNPSSAWLSKDTLFAVVDAGGSTVDSTLYKCEATEPKLSLAEAVPSECVQAGGIFVDRAARALFESKLCSSKFDLNTNFDRMEAYFKENVKSSFDGTQRSMGITVGGAYENDLDLSINEGQLSLQQGQICEFFEDVIKRIKRSCRKLMGNGNVKYLLLVGGFGESPYLRKMLYMEFKAMGVSIVTVGNASKKAAAEGALMWLLQHSVTTRIAKITLGMECTPDYDPMDPEHEKRSARLIEGQNGAELVPEEFCVLIQKVWGHCLVAAHLTPRFKGQVIGENFMHEQEFHVHCESQMKNKCAFKLYVWEGQGVPKWITDTRGDLLRGMRVWGHLEIDMVNIRPFIALQRKRGRDFYKIDFRVIIKPNGTQLQAMLRAQYNDTICEGPITFVPGAVSKK